MHLTALTIENFKGIREPLRIEFSPITLLFGPNSAGKSTIVQALHFACEVFERGNANPDRTIIGGDSIDLGGYMNLVYNHERDREIAIRLDFDISDIDLPEMLPESHDRKVEDDINSLLSSVKTGWIKIRIEWNTWRNEPVVKSYVASIDGNKIAEILASESYSKIGISFYNHKYLRTDEIDEIRFEKLGRDLKSELKDEEEEQTSLLQWDDDLSEDWSDSYNDMEPDEHSDDIILEDFYKYENDEGSPDTSGFFAEYEIRQKSVLPDWDTSLIIEAPFWDIFDGEQNNYFQRLINLLVVAPGKIVRDLLREYKYIGPLRVVPERSYRSQLTVDESRWANGLASWDLMFECQPEFLDEINRWLTNQDMLNTGYRIEAKKFKELNVNDPVMLMLTDGIEIEDAELIQNRIKDLSVKTRVSIREEATGIELMPQDIGVGISQMLPIIVGALHLEQGILAIEQPELHIHPALQVSLGDLFISQVQKKEIAFLIETHSEHLMLRFLRRIRETAEEVLPPGKWPLKPEQLSIYYLEQSDQGITSKKIRVDKDGEFIDRWPKGFFEEREEELLY